MNSPREWKCIPAREGLLVSRSGSPDDDFFLPGVDTSDTPLSQPPLSLLLNDAEVNELRSRVPSGPVVATCYGPPEPEQEKISNQDFALSAVIQTRAQAVWSFAAVADGVSTRTFWPERAARIACLSAYKTIRAFVNNGEIEQQESLGQLRTALCDDLRGAFIADRKIIVTSTLTPFGWDPAVYRDRGKSDEYWYNTTLLICALGPIWGFLTWAGDGAICLVKSDTTSEEERTVLETTESLTIEQFVSLGVGPNQFRAARISYPEGASGAVQIYLSTDGLDRTLKLNDGRWTYRTLNLSNTSAATQQLIELSRISRHEKDNYSVAKLSWPISDRTAMPSDAPRGQRSGSRQAAATPRIHSLFEASPQAELKPDTHLPDQVALEPSETTKRKLGSILELCLVFTICFLGYLAWRPTPTIQVPERLAKGAPLAPLPRPFTPAKKTTLPAIMKGPMFVGPPSVAPPESVLRLVAYELADNQRRKDLDARRLSDDLQETIDYWAQFIRDHPGSQYTIVAYSDRNHPDSATECKKYAALALKRAAFVVEQLGSKPGISALLNHEGRQRVCEPPPGVHDIKAVATRRIVLLPSDIASCICSDVAKETKK